VTIYEHRIRRSVEKNMAELRVLQAERKAAVERTEKKPACSSNSQSTKAITTIQPTISRPNLSPLGFIFSRSKILREIERDSRLSRARALESRGEFDDREPAARVQRAHKAAVRGRFNHARCMM